MIARCEGWKLVETDGLVVFIGLFASLVCKVNLKKTPKNQNTTLCFILLHSSVVKRRGYSLPVHSRAANASLCPWGRQRVFLIKPSSLSVAEVQPDKRLAHRTRKKRALWLDIRKGIRMHDFAWTFLTIRLLRTCQVEDLWLDLSGFPICLFAMLWRCIRIPRLLQDPAFKSGKFGEIKNLLIGMLETYRYERTLLDKTLNLLARYQPLFLNLSV